MLSQLLIHLNDHSVGPVAPYARMGTPTKVPNTVKKVVGYSDHLNTHCELACYSVENTKSHHSWESYHLLEFAMGSPIRMGE